MRGLPTFRQIGSGLAGLTSAYLLSRQPGFEIHIFESADKIGLDSAGVDVSVFKDGKSLDVSIDVPMRSMDAGLHPSETKS
jgi:predicted NAD/FAD-binding protein